MHGWAGGWPGALQGSAPALHPGKAPSSQQCRGRARSRAGCCTLASPAPSRPGPCTPFCPGGGSMPRSSRQAGRSSAWADGCRAPGLCSLPCHRLSPHAPGVSLSLHLSLASGPKPKGGSPLSLAWPWTLGSCPRSGEPPPHTAPSTPTASSPQQAAPGGCGAQLLSRLACAGRLCTTSRSPAKASGASCSFVSWSGLGSWVPRSGQAWGTFVQTAGKEEVWAGTRGPGQSPPRKHQRARGGMNRHGPLPLWACHRCVLKPIGCFIKKSPHRCHGCKICSSNCCLLHFLRLILDQSSPALAISLFCLGRTSR